MAAMRPLIAAEPMLRAPRPEMVSASTVTGLVDAGTTGADSPAVTGWAGSAAAFAAGVLDLVALLLVVDEGAVEVGGLEDVFELVLAEGLRVLLAVERIDLPAVLPVVGVDAGHPLEDEFLPHHGGALVLLHDLGFAA